MLRFTLLALLLAVFVTQVQAGNKGPMTVFDWCRRGVRPTDQGANHNRFKRECAKKLGIDLSDKSQRTKEFGRCNITPYGWYNEEKQAFDVENFKNVIMGYVGYSDLTDLQKNAIGDGWDDCLTKKEVQFMRWNVIMDCLATKCKNADNRIPETIDEMGGYWD